MRPIQPNRLKNLSTAMNVIRSAIKILLRGLEPNVKIFRTKIVQFSPRAEQTDVTQVYHRGSWGAEPPPVGDFCDFAAKNSDFNAILILFRTFVLFFLLS